MTHATAPSRPPILEREADLARIEACLGRARDGHGGVLVVEGPAGIGKTSLLAAARARAEAGGMRVLRARSAELERDFAFGVVRQLFEPALARADEKERRAVLQGAAGLAGRLLALPGAGVQEERAADTSFAVLHGLYWLCAGLAAERPLCLAVDDAHWADVPSLRFLVFLLARLEELPVALVVAARPGEGPAGELLAAIGGDAAAQVVAPAALSAGAVGRLIAEGSGRPPEDGFVAACHHATGGNPFLIGQLVLALAEGDVAPTADAAAEIERLGARWAARWILLRLERLPEPAARLARALAVLERSALAPAAALAGLDGDAAAAAADALVAAGIVAPGRPLGFVHPIVRTGIYTEIGTAERARWHRAAARLLAGTSGTDDHVAEHLLACEPAGDGWVVERLVASARAAARSGAPELAATHLRRALAEPPPRGDRPALLLELGVAEDNAGSPDADAHLEAAVQAAQDPAARVTAAVVLGHALARRTRFAEALAVLDRALAVAPPGTPGARSAESLAASIATFSVPTAEANAARIARARACVDDAEPPTHEQLALAAQLAVRANEPADVAAGLAARALGVARGALPEPTDLPWFHQCAITLLWAERYAELHALLGEAIASARSRGDAAMFSGALVYRGWLALRRGDLPAAEADARTALEAEHLPAPAMYRQRGAAVLVELLVEQGELDRAEAVLAPLHAHLRGESTIAAGLRLARGRLRLAQRRCEDGLADLVAAGEVGARTGLLSPSCLPWRSQAAAAQLALGRVEEARRLAGDELALARAFGAPRALGVALQAAGLAAADEGLLREAVAALERADARLELARARTALGALLRRRKRRAAARELLAEALDAAHRAGAVPLAAHAEAELRATGARPRRAVRSGLDALTASERRVAELAAGGLTNREIAQALFVTMRTVEGHLTHVFQKLGLRSRGQLARALEADR